MASLIFFSCKKTCQTKSFCLRMVKNCQHQHKGKPHTQEKFQDAAISVKVATLIFRGFNICGAHCNYALLSIHLIAIRHYKIQATMLDYYL
jgi:hypothetical protein